MKIIIVTGLSGAGKTQAMGCLEDIGYYCIDNMPPALIKSFVELSQRNKNVDKAALGIDARGGEFFNDLSDALDELKKEGLDYKMIFLEASDRVLARRYSETRREHPLAIGESATKGIKRERKILDSIRKEADNVIDTSNFKNAQLASTIRNIVAESEDRRTYVIKIMSFGYKNGMPVSADMMFDARFLPNPYYVKSLKPLTGNNRKVQNYVMKNEIAQQFMDEVTQTIINLIPYYEQEGKFSLSVCFGCTGGQHRSVTLANELNRRLQERGIRTTLEHRDL